MGLEFQLFLEMGVILFLAFLGVLLTNKFGQSVLLAYILIGMIIGPFGIRIIRTKPLPLDSSLTSISVDQVTGVFIYFFSMIGLVLLLFFVGLEFSVSKLKWAQKPALILATVDVAINLFIGFSLGMFFGWPLVDTIFLACIIAMSSVAITIKILEEMKKANTQETEILISVMVVEDIASIVLLTCVSSFILGRETTTYNIMYMLIGVVVLFIFFTILSFIFIPTMLRKFKKIERGEAFILFALGIVFLSAALAEFFGIAAFVGAFLIGMGFAETKLTNQLKEELMNIKNIFVAVFFISFGMVIDPTVLIHVGHIVALAVPLTILNEVILLAMVAFMIGLSGSAAVSIGCGALGRSEEAIIFANVGTNLKTSTGTPILNPTGSSSLSPFAGIYCLIMSVITPFFMRASGRIYNFLSTITPEYMKFSGTLISSTVKRIVFHVPADKKDRGLGIGHVLSAYFVLMLVLILSGVLSGEYTLFGIPLTFIMITTVSVLIIVILMLLWHYIYIRLQPVVRNIEIAGIPLNREAKLRAVHFVSGYIVGTLAVFMMMAIVWSFDWRIAIAIILIYPMPVIIACWRIWRRLTDELLWASRYEHRTRVAMKPIVKSVRPARFTYRGEPWEIRNRQHRKNHK